SGRRDTRRAPWPDRNSSRRGISASLAAGKGHRNSSRNKTILNGQRQLSRSHEQHARGREQSTNFFERLSLSAPVKINQQIAAKNEIVFSFSRSKIIAQQIRLPEIH